MEEVTLQKYWDILNRHDWYWVMSDDMRSYNDGQKREAELKAIAETSIEHSIMYKGFSDYHWTGEPWNTVKTLKPGRPT